MDNTPILKPTAANIQTQYKTKEHKIKQILTAITNQTEINWEHILHSRISKDWEPIATANWNKKRNMVNKFYKSVIKHGYKHMSVLSRQ